MDSINESKKCHLLDLPGDLRNRIYRFVLVSGEEIEVESTGPGEPALLRTCKTTREESIDIYYSENFFNIQIADWNGRALLPFMQQQMARKVVTMACFEVYGARNWDNLVAWPRVEWMGEAYFPQLHQQPARDPDDYVVGGALRIVRSMMRLKWEDIEEALEAFYYALRSTNLPWVKAEDRVTFCSCESLAGCIR